MVKSRAFLPWDTVPQPGVVIVAPYNESKRSPLQKARAMYPVPNPPPSPDTLPSMYDLPSENIEDPGLPDEFHLAQPRLLEETCHPPTYPPNQIFIASDLNLYYDPTHPLWYKRPDWFIVLGKSPAITQQDLRLSYVIWQEGTAPFLVVELLSPGTEAEDLGQTLREVNTPPTKWQVYEQILRIPYYAIFDRYTNELQLFQLVGARYAAMPLTEQRFWFEEMQLGLGVWHGSYRGVTGLWLRWYCAGGDWLPMWDEQLQQERHRADQERHRADRLAQQLRALGIEPDRPD